MYLNLPPIQALRSFEAAARLSSISLAALELCVTQGAVSKQVKQLEAMMGIALFIRSTKGLYLTEQGQSYFNSVVQSLNILSLAGDSLRCEPRQQQLLIDVIPSMSHIWLIPRIHSFEARFGHLKVDLICGDGDPDFNHSQADLSIRSFNVDAVPAASIELFSERLVLVAAPTLLKESPIAKLEDLLVHKLLQQNTRLQMWRRFFAEQKLNVADGQLTFGIGFQHFFMSLKAAEEGLGIALIPDFLARQSIAKGLLVNPLQLQMDSEYRYYLLSPSYKTKLNKVQLFNQWIIKEINR